MLKRQLLVHYFPKNIQKSDLEISVNIWFMDASRFKRKMIGRVAKADHIVSASRTQE